MYAEGILQRGGFHILLQSIYLGEINTQHFILGSNEFLLQKKEFMLILMILGEIICGSDPQSLAGSPEGERLSIPAKSCGAPGDKRGRAGVRRSQGKFRIPILFLVFWPLFW